MRGWKGLLESFDPLTSAASQQVKKLANQRGQNELVAGVLSRARIIGGSPGGYFKGLKMTSTGVNRMLGHGGPSGMTRSWTRDFNIEAVKNTRRGAAQYLGALGVVNTLDSDSNVAWLANTTAYGVGAYGAWGVGKHMTRNLSPTARGRIGVAGAAATGIGALHRFGVL